jgi:hypothetical protein
MCVNSQPIPRYVANMLKKITQIFRENPDAQFMQELINQLWQYSLQHFGKQMPPDEFQKTFTGELLKRFIHTESLDVVGNARLIIQQESSFPLGDYPMTWTEAIGKALREMSWRWHSLRMSQQEFDKLYPPSFFPIYAEFMGYDCLF